VINLKKEEKINKILNDIRPALMNDGGNVEFVKLEDDIVYVRFQGACSGCPMRQMTFKEGIERILLENVEDIKGVELVD